MTTWLSSIARLILLDWPLQRQEDQHGVANHRRWVLGMWFAAAFAVLLYWFPAPAADHTALAACPELIVDGSFSAIVNDTTDPPWIVTGNARFDAPDGGFALLGYNNTPATGELAQPVDVPAAPSSAVLSFSYQFGGFGVTSAPNVVVDVSDATETTVLVALGQLDLSSGDPKQYSHTLTPAELAAIGGRRVMLRFRISGVDDFKDVIIDNVSGPSVEVAEVVRRRPRR
ncbi:MAG: hypothetical protein KatS3mg061_2155 [Dehalococcoidia bacterium]|nr:MAG: hypothetical protein KatS3mg061_2155 [Dehalococcoidia bacterium]